MGHCQHVDDARGILAFDVFGVNLVGDPHIADLFRLQAEMEERLGVVGRQELRRYCLGTVRLGAAEEELVVIVGNDANIARAIDIDELLGVGIDVGAVSRLQQHRRNQRLRPRVVDVDRPVGRAAAIGMASDTNLALVYIGKRRGQFGAVVDAGATGLVALRPSQHFREAMAIHVDGDDDIAAPRQLDIGRVLHLAAIQHAMTDDDGRRRIFGRHAGWLEQERALYEPRRCFPANVLDLDTAVRRLHPRSAYCRY